MGNVLYDLDLTRYGIPTFGLTPYIGGGAGLPVGPSVADHHHQ